VNFIVHPVYDSRVYNKRDPNSVSWRRYDQRRENEQRKCEFGIGDHPVPGDGTVGFLGLTPILAEPGAGPAGRTALAGGAPGINSFLGIDFDEGYTVIVLSNYDVPVAIDLGKDILTMVTSTSPRANE